MARAEVWKDVPEFIGVCQASNLGRIRTLQRNGSWMVREPDTSPYPGVHISVGGKKYRRGVHILVLCAFKGQRPEGKFGCHNDGNRYNNKPSNLDWKTPKQNSADRVRHGTQFNGTRVFNSRLTEGKVLAIRASKRSTAYLAVVYGVSPESIRNVRKRRTWKHI